MVKTNILTPVLAGVLGLSIVGSGLGYYFVNKNADEANSNKQNAKLSTVAGNINNTLDNAEKAMKGELDFAYDGSVKVTFGDGFTELTGQSVSPVSMNISTKQKGKNMGMDYTLAYGGSDFISMNAVLAREENAAYLQIPEFSDAYLKVYSTEAENYVKDELGVDFGSFDTSDVDMNIDYEGLEASLDEYEQVIKDNLPEGTEGDKLEGDIDGVKYELTTKSYTITGTDAAKAAKAVLEKAKTDTNFKSIYDQAMEETYGAMTTTDVDSEYSYTPPTYEEAIDELIAELDTDIDSSEAVDFISYYNDGEFAGFKLVPDDDEGELNAIMISTDEAEAVDIKFDGGDGTAMTMYGAIKDTDGVLNGSYDISVKEDDAENVQVIFEVKDLQESGDSFKGIIRADVNFTSDTEAFSGWFEMSSDSTDDNVDLTVEVGANGKSVVTVDFESKKTEASDVAIPTGTTYNAFDEAQMEEYLATWDIEGFETKLRNVLGDELYTELFENDYTYDDDYDLYDDYDWSSDDYDWDDDDYDWDEYDLDEDDWDLDYEDLDLDDVIA